MFSDDFIGGWDDSESLRSVGFHTGFGVDGAPIRLAFVLGEQVAVAGYSRTSIFIFINVGRILIVLGDKLPTIGRRMELEVSELHFEGRGKEVGRGRMVELRNLTVEKLVSCYWENPEVERRCKD